jgi:hypothetical protein
VFGGIGSGTALPDGRSRVRFAMVSLEIFIAIVLPARMSPQPLKRNEFLGVKASGA